MLADRKVIVCIPSGRYKYLRILLPYLLNEQNSKIVDEVQLWVNTNAEIDLAYFEKVEQNFTIVKRVFVRGTLKNDVHQFNDYVYRFYKNCTSPDTVYVKMDDDICYVHHDFLENFVKITIECEQSNLACVGNVFNVPYVTKLLQEKGVITDVAGKSTGDPRCPIACVDGKFAANIHDQFLNLIEQNQIEKLFFDSHNLKGRQRIGAMAWTGKNFALFNGEVLPSDEVDLTTTIPNKLGMPLHIVGNAVVSHFAFSHQRDFLESKTDVLERYLRLSIDMNGDNENLQM